MGGATSGLVVVSAVMVMVMTYSSDAFKDDETIYKWSPLWFNRYYSRGHNLYKRVRDEDQDPSWSPDSFLGYPDYVYNKRTSVDGSAGRCMKENAPCSYVARYSGELVRLRCCGALQCVDDGLMHTCTNVQSLLDADYEE
ncbi:uncharacterized protein LOC108679724 isoform X3 [Hyalella azteca]|uniref:Uncharacterized protein LOC108679724 isoform X1 n=1 Tax=Hyalella azteca TaxID=294128 RepID=A0A8B7PE93_HYAAZ|nr:uncharacterized protein LOC108679724 isoform X1 [Hyalella azteca]XP_018023923.1 uncharacterized protein LOC108679724 isoform X1 [Hyalella azteca]XP_047737698.1 uncharacterized protein LOC108679724 isoform X2 [Hyalella azteca]XP_047737699.1 uncharacterized protein LOC108679724 isoform X3 [Hyalella azteca]